MRRPTVVGKKKKRRACSGVCLLTALGTIAAVLTVLPFALHLQLPEISLDVSLPAGVGNVPPVRSRLDMTKRSDDDNDDDIVHIVFSTDCSGYQHWQGIALWYAAQAAGQRGPITRIASGCQKKEQDKITSEWRKIDKTGRFRVHFTSSMKLHGSYKYSNKPGGIKHWLENANPPITESYVCLLDPDMLPLLPITTALGRGLGTKPRHRSEEKQVEFVDSQTGVARILRTSDTMEHMEQEIPSRVALGSPAGQHFGIGGDWATAGSPRARPVWKNFSKSNVCGVNGPCVTTSYEDARNKYAVGPVYLAHVDDWRRIAHAWWSAMPRVHDQYPHLLAEMYALTMATSNLTLPWTLISNYMVSGPGVTSPTEAWSWIDDLTKNSRGNNATVVCDGASLYTLPFVTRNRTAVALPTTLHFCQRYEVAGHLFAKHKIPHDFFRCDGDPMPLNVDALMDGLVGNPSKIVTRKSFMMCHLIPILNLALKSYKRDVCTI
eukprot:CAMPEP_0198305828 /NCGR_PEP_ID=MMETSP1449-20131203/58107_1 /TAXON_ID=420275 /ORGANISM="Attheya septentrionalis, Strain CCMP2084" /LENGTH=491 /DNA_ID=CAMNT_0044008369 /DNA_START=144 /DNA_END=1619 /DNA_ORIENTATION=+